MSDTPTSDHAAPASPQQRRAAALADPSAPAAALVGAAYALSGPLDVQVLTDALQRAAEELEVLRTDLVAEGGGVTQVVRDAARSGVDADDRAHPDAAALLAAHAAEAKGDAHVHARLGTAAGVAHLSLLRPRTLDDAAGVDALARALLAVLAGEAPEQPQDEDGTALRYADLAALQQDLLADEETAAARARLGALPLAAAPGQRLGLERPLGGSGAHELVRPLTADEVAGLHALATRAGASRAAVALAAWAVVVARQADAAEPLLAVAAPGRDYEGLDVAVGALEKHVPLVLGPRAGETFDALARRAQAALEGALDDHDGWDPAAVATPLPHAFAWRGAFEAERGGRRLAATARRGQAEPARALLAVEAVGAEADDAWALRVVTDAAALDPAAARALADQVVACLGGAHARPEAAAAELTLCSTAWRAELAAGLDTTPAGAREATTITRLLAATAARAGDAVAVRCPEARDGAERSYAELEARSNRLARHLRDLGVGPGRFVGVYLDRGPWLVESLLAVLKAGGAYLPLPPSYPDERVRFMLADTGAPVVLTSTARSGRLPETNARVVVPDQLDGALAALDAGPLDEAHGPDDPAYVIYTSGSTGRPKGVAITHSNLCHSTLARREHYGAPVGTYLLLSSIAFDSSVPGLFWTLADGGTLVLPPEGAERELGALPALVARHGVTHLLALPSVYALLLDGAAPGQLDSLRVVVVAGESAARELVARHAERLPATELHDEYGPTENTVWSSVQRCTPADAYATVPIGRPVPGVRAYVARADTSPPEPEAPGVPGELVVGGPQLAPGYLGRPELTAERFVADADGARVYRTGDLARMHPDGTLEFLGRLDSQVKLRGYRIELEEVEAVLAEHTGVRAAVVAAPDLAPEGAPPDRRLVAYVVGDVDADALRAHVAAKCPEYMVPAHVVALDALPLLPNGKVDRRALPPPERGGGGGARTVAAAGPPLERLIAHLWAELLDVDAVDPEDDFFDLGGHSLLAARCFARLGELLQVEAPLRLLFDHPTARGLAAAIEAQPEDGARAARAAAVALEVLGLDDAAPVSAGPTGGTSLERLVAALWADGLGVDAVGPDEDFFDLGGHSLLAARLFAQMNELLQVEAPLRLLFDHPTVAGLCRALAAEDPAGAARLERTAELALQVLEDE